MGTPKRDRARHGFTPPTLDEVEAFMKTARPKWPIAFCEWYAQKFFYYYKSTGWKLSSNVPLKDWQAAFYSRWESLSTKEAQDMLTALQKTPAHLQYLDQLRRQTAGLFAEVEAKEASNPIDHMLHYLDDIMDKELKGLANDTQLDALADWLRPRQLLRIRNEQIDAIKAKQGNDGNYGKRLAVKCFVRNLQEKGLTIKSYFYKRQTLSNAKTDR